MIEMGMIQFTILVVLMLMAIALGTIESRDLDHHFSEHNKMDKFGAYDEDGPSSSIEEFKTFEDEEIERLIKKYDDIDRKREG